MTTPGRIHVTLYPLTEQERLDLIASIAAGPADPGYDIEVAAAPRQPAPPQPPRPAQSRVLHLSLVM